jgi:hypothetical protein
MRSLKNITDELESLKLMKFHKMTSLSGSVNFRITSAI